MTVNNAGAFLNSRAVIATAARDRGYKVNVVSPGGPQFGEITASGFAAHSFPLNRASVNPFLEIRARKSLRELYNKLQPALVHNIYWKPIVHGGWAAGKTKVPAVVHTVGGMGYAFSESTLKALLARIVLKSSIKSLAKHPNMCFLVQNDDDAALLRSIRGVDGDRVVKVPGSGVDLGKYSVLPEPEGAPLVVFPSRLLWSKGVKEFVQAARTLKKRGSPAKFALVGDTDPGNPAAVPRQTLRSWHEEGVIQFWGWRPDMVEVYRQAHIICLPTKYREGVPRVLLEAAACGRPIVTTDMPGCRDICKNDQTGILCKVGDSKDLADALDRLLNDAELRDKMAKSARALVEREFDQKLVIGKTLDLYQKMMKNV